jgi:hypothetical protein
LIVVMAITNSEQDTITEAEFVKVAMLTSNGRAVPARPVVDDEHRDFDIHLRRKLAAIATQLKTTLRLRKHGRQRIMQITFYLRPPLFRSRRFWYFFAHFDTKTMTFIEPVFLVPSTFVHKYARRAKRLIRGAIPFQIKASMALNADDEWTPFRLTLAELGPRIVQILKQLGSDKELMLMAARDLDAIVLVRPSARKPSGRRLRAAA